MLLVYLCPCPAHHCFINDKSLYVPDLFSWLCFFPPLSYYSFFSWIFLLSFCCLHFRFRTSTCLPVNLASLFDTHNNQLVLNSRATLPWEKSNLLLAFCQETRLIVDLSQVPQSLPDVLEVKQKASNRS